MSNITITLDVATATQILVAAIGNAATLNQAAADIASVKSMLAQQGSAITALAQQEKIDMAKVDDDFAALLAKTTAESSVIDSIQALVTQLVAGLDLSPAQQAQFDAIMSQVDSNDTKLAAALASGTPVPPASLTASA